MFSSEEGMQNEGHETEIEMGKMKSAMEMKAKDEDLLLDWDTKGQENALQCTSVYKLLN